MIIKRVKLNNIRSYSEQEIIFPQGSILLAGNIGSGKSSILLAIDFALFGLQKGNISGASLLRNDANKGFVELEFSLDDKNIIINRSLKREGDKIIQDIGYLSVNNKKESLTAVELKQRILDLLNYPRELLTKSKSLIYRYTVYTPQEEMKHILQAEKDTRLDILRKIFGIDKYKRESENSKIFISHIKEKKKEFLGFILDLNEKENLKKEIEKKRQLREDDVKKLIPRLSNVAEILEIKKNKLKSIEEKISELNKLKHELGINETNIKHKISLRENTLIEINRLELEIKDFKEKQFSISDIKDKIKLKEDCIKKLEQEIKDINIKLSEFKVHKRNSEILKKKITELDECPTCQQKVTKDYKEQISTKEEKNIIDFNKNIELLTKNMEEKDTEFIDMRKDFDYLKKEEQEYEIYKIKLENNREKRKRFDLLVQGLNDIKKEIDKLQSENKKINESALNYKSIDREYENIKNELDLSIKEQKSIEIEHTRIKNDLDNINENISNLDKEIKNKMDIKDKLNKYSEIQNWLEKDFANLIENMEKQIMHKIYHDFNALFQKWFSMLIDNESLTIKLDNEFSPLIQQNNYDIDYDYISGGERTAAALAYRLALNQVVNNLITNIKTKDLLILDEPTDGFSSDQLDKIRQVLNELNIKQTIIVSHDPKIESFVDNVIRMNKKEHVTSID